jgi:tetratricopeptide (TPR) repeat protein
MFRRTLTVFLGLVLLVLAATLGYALLGLSGPESHVAAAREEAERGNHLATIRLLDIAERSLGDESPRDLQVEMLRLRVESFLAVGNYPPAIRDIQRLRELLPDDLDLVRDQVRWTIVSGEPEQALELAQSFLEAQATDSAMLELAGEASQAVYQTRLRELLAEVSAQFDPISAEQAFESIRTWVYRSSRDPVANLAIERFSELLRTVRPEIAASGRLETELQDIRAMVSQAIDYFSRSLENEGSPVGAYAGVAYAMRQAGRFDDLQWLSEIYLERFEHVYVTMAAAHLAELHLQHGRHRAAAEVRERFLPPGTWRERLDAGRLDQSLARLLLAEARSLAALGEVETLRQRVAEAEEIEADGRISLMPDLLWCRATLAEQEERDLDAMRDLAAYNEALSQAPQSPEVVQRRIEVMNIRLRIATERNFGPDFFTYAYQTLARLDPQDPRPTLEQSRFRIEQDDPEGALLELRSARRVADHDEEYLKLEARSMAGQFDKSGRGPAVQLGRCLELGIEVPLDIPDVLLLPVAEEALRAGHPRIAAACARRAADRFNWARWPRQLQVRAAFALGDPESARRAAEAILTYHPGNLDALLDLREARRQLEQGSEDLVYDLLLAGQEDATTTRALLEKALARGDATLAGHLARTIERRYRDDPAALLAVARIQEDSGDLSGARETLLRANELAARIGESGFTDAFDRYVVLTATTVADSTEVREIVERATRLHREDPTRLAYLARELYERGQPAFAQELLAPLLQDEDHATSRTGEHYLLAGRISLELGDLDEAEHQFLAALTFPDAQVAGRLITLLQIERERFSEAAESFWEQEANDLTSAALFARFDRQGVAASWVRRRLAESPADAGGLALASVVAPSDRLPAPFQSLAAAAPQELLDCLAFLDAEGFEERAIERARALVAQTDQNPVARVLLARVLTRAGRIDESLAILDGVLADEPLLIPAYEEALIILEGIEGLRFADSPVVARLVQPTMLQSGLATPRMVAFATRQRATQLVARLRQEAGSVEELAALWLTSPAGGETSLDQIAVLGAVGRPDLALQLCDAVEPHVSSEQRRRFASLAFAMANARLAESGEGTASVARDAEARARRFLALDGSIGVSAHFLFDRDIATRGPLGDRRDPERTRSLATFLETHLHAVREGVAGESSMLLATLQRYAELRGRRAAIDLATERLRVDPSLIAVWIQRARWIAQEGEPDQAIDGLRWIHHYVPTHPSILDCVELSAREGVVHEDDLRVVESQILDQAQLETADALLTRGLIALRRGAYSNAVELLERSATRPDGAHLYYRGLALMPLGRHEEARELLEACAEQFPESPLTVSAEHFAHQLAR